MVIPQKERLLISLLDEHRDISFVKELGVVNARLVFIVLMLILLHAVLLYLREELTLSSAFASEGIKSEEASVGAYDDVLAALIELD